MRMKWLAIGALALLPAGFAVAQQAQPSQDQSHPHRRGFEQRFKAADSNSDGAISREEFLANADKMFQRIDQNADGRITQEELQKMRHHRGHRPAQ